MQKTSKQSNESKTRALNECMKTKTANMSLGRCLLRAAVVAALSVACIRILAATMDNAKCGIPQLEPCHRACLDAPSHPWHGHPCCRTYFKNPRDTFCVRKEGSTCWYDSLALGMTYPGGCLQCPPLSNCDDCWCTPDGSEPPWGGWYARCQATSGG